MIEKILNKIHEVQDGLIDAQGNFASAKNEGAYHALCDLEAYIDSLSEESESKDLKEAAYRYAIGCEPLRHEYGGYTSPNPEVENAVIYGANWQRNHVWHDIREKPDMRKFVVFSDGKKTMTPPLRNPFDDYPMLIDVANRKYGGGYKVWAYLEDLLPNDKED